MKGIFITFEGGEGCGKTTQLALLREYLESRGRAVEVTREPGGTPVAESIRELLLDPANTAIGATTELLLYEAARAQHVDERIRPALDAGCIVLCDRFADSTTAYQGAGRCLPPEIVHRLHEIATRGVWPQLTIVIDLPVEEGLRRVRKYRESDRIERETVAFHERVREGFLELSRLEPDRVRVVDGAQPVDAVAADIRALTDPLLEAV
jgi:dTMP kinase